MTTFIDGPAQGKTLMLHRAVKFLRVTEKSGAFDALDQPEDTPLPEEKLYAYEMHQNSGHCHINRGGGRGGFYPIVSYKFVPIQPSDAEMRDGESWRKWCESQVK